MFKAGFITLLGKPNVGKSTLINTLVGEKVSIVTWRPQTTRDKIIGIANGEDYQAVFVDTPGMHKAKNALSDYMIRSIESASEGVDVYLYLIACDKKVDHFDIDYINKLARSKAPVIVCINKCDEVEDKDIFERINAIKDIENVKAIMPISALDRKSVV